MDEMKKWIKAHLKQIGIGWGIFFIINALLGLTINRPDGAWIIIHIIALSLWVIILFFLTGAAGKIANWWKKD